MQNFKGTQQVHTHPSNIFTLDIRAKSHIYKAKSRQPQIVGTRPLMCGAHKVRQAFSHQTTRTHSCDCSHRISCAYYKTPFPSSHKHSLLLFLCTRSITLKKCRRTQVGEHSHFAFLADDSPISLPIANLATRWRRKSSRPSTDGSRDATVRSQATDAAVWLMCLLLLLLRHRCILLSK